MHPDQISIRINLAISPGLLSQVDDLARRNYQSRSQLIRSAIFQYLNQRDNVAKLNAKPGEDILVKDLEEYIKKFYPEEGI